MPTTAGELSFDVSGAANLIALDNGNHSSDDLFAVNKKVFHNGFVMAILRSTQKAGTVKLKVSATGLKPMEQTFSVQ